MRLNKRQLDAISTVLGLVAMVSGVLVANQYNPQLWGAVNGISLGLLGFLTNRPATVHPTTADLEERRRYYE